jgi:ribonuclease P protein component
MISRAHRFHGYNSLKRVYKYGESTRGPLLAVKSILNERRKSYRVAVVVSRKVNKSAVARNRIRRRLYEIVRGLENTISEPHDIVITVFHDSVREEPADKLQKQVQKQLIEAGIIKK